MEKLIRTLLDDENGISEDSYEALLACISGDLTLDNIERERLLKLVSSADATDGRFYFPA